MTKVKAAILVDIGNSETRFILVYEGKTWLRTMSNGFAKLTEGYTVPEDYLNDKTCVIRLGDDFYANGELAAREFAYKVQTPVVIKAKSEQQSTVRTFSLCFIEAFKKLSEITGTPVGELDVLFDVATALPPTEHKLCSEKLKTLIRGITTVESVTPVAFKKSIALDNIYVVSEGAAAFTAVMYDEIPPAEGGGVCENEKNSMFFDGDVLVIDIGAGTSDMILFRDGDVILNAKDTFKKGGEAIKSKCRQYIKEKYGYTPSDKSMEAVISEGQLVKGTETYDVVPLLQNAKEEFSAELYNRLTEYIQAHNIEPNELKGLLVVGGGSLPAIRNGRVVSPSLSDVVINYIKEITESIALVDIKGINPRLLNIEGLRMFYLYRNN